MTDSDIRTLKSYLAGLELRQQFAKKEIVRFLNKKELDGDDIAARIVIRYFDGQATALQHAIDDFKELFEEELKEGE